MNKVVDELDGSDFEDSEDDLMDTWTLTVTLRQTGIMGKMILRREMRKGEVENELQRTKTYTWEQTGDWE